MTGSPHSRRLDQASTALPTAVRFSLPDKFLQGSIQDCSLAGRTTFLR